MLLNKRSFLISLLILVVSQIALSSTTRIRLHNGLHLKDQCVDKGFGFKAVRLSDIKKAYEQMKNLVPAAFEEFSKIIKPLMDKFDVEKVTSKVADIAVGDYTTDEMTGLSTFSCNVIPYPKGITFGTVAVDLKNLPCPAGTQVSACFNWSTCGSFSLSFNGGLPACLATLTGVGAALAPFVKTIGGVGLAFNMNNQIPLDVSIAEYDNKKNELVEAVKTIKGNIFFTIKFDLTSAIFPNDNFKIADKKLSELFTCSGTANAIIDFGSTFSTLKTGLLNTIRGAKNDGMLKELLNSGAESAFEANAELGFKLSMLTKDMLPDLNVGKVKINIVGSLGNGLSGIKRGVYIALDATLTLFQSFYEGLVKTLSKILNFFGIKTPDVNLNIKAHLGLSVTDEVIGFRIAGAFGENSKPLSCLYRFSDKTFSCAALEAIFNVVKDGANWVVNKASAFFQSVGDKIVVAFDDAKKWLVSNIVNPLDNFFSGKATSPPCNKGQNNIAGKCYKKNLKRNYYNLYLKMQRFHKMNKLKRRLF